MEINVDNLMAAVNSKYKWSLQLKDNQRIVILQVLQKQHVLVVLPTGYGKSLCYTLPALLLDEVSGIKICRLGVISIFTML